jgi:magnesium transporter
MIIDSAHYLDGVRQQEEPADVAELKRRVDERGGFALIMLTDPTSEEMEELQGCFDLPALAVEDAQEGRQRPKLEQYGDESLPDRQDRRVRHGPPLA